MPQITDIAAKSNQARRDIAVLDDVLEVSVLTSVSLERDGDSSWRESVGLVRVLTIRALPCRRPAAPSP
jgi:hypothetical protein